MKRLSNAILVVVFLSAALLAQSDIATWIVWTRANHFPIASINTRSDDDFADLQFLKDVVGDRRLVQLGESGHGVAEFDLAKDRLVRFFHEQMGFDVIAFESSIYECFSPPTRPPAAATCCRDRSSPSGRRTKCFRCSSTSATRSGPIIR